MGEFLRGGGGQLAPIVVPVVIDEAAFQASLKSIDKGMTKVTRRVGAMANKIGNYGLMAAGAIGAIGFAALKAAREAEDAARKFNIVFGAQAAATLAWAKQIGDVFHVTTPDMQQFLATMQDLFVPMGYSRKEAAGLSKEVVNLALHLSALGHDTKTVMQDVTSGLIGQHETVRRYGIMLDEVRLKQIAWNNGITETGEELTQSQKVVARLRGMYEDSRDALEKGASLMKDSIRGDMAQIQKAFDTLRIEVGKSLAPVLANLTEDMIPILKSWVEWVKSNRALIVQIAELVPLLIKVSVALKGVRLAAEGLAALKWGLGTLGALGAGGGPAAALTAAAGAAAYMHYKAARIRIQAQEDAARHILKQTDIQLKSLLKHESKLRLAHARKVAGESVTTFFDVFRDKFQEGSQAVEPFMRVTLEMIGKASKEELGGLESEIDALLMTTRELTLEQHTKLIGAINAKLAEFYDADVAKAKEIEEKKARLRVEHFEAAMAEIQGSVVRNLNAELSNLRRAVADQERIREDSLRRVMEVRAEMLEREIDHEQFLWQAALQDPAVATEERYFETEQRIEEMIDGAQRAADEGNAEVSQRLLTMAEQLSKSLVSIDEHTYEVRLGDARDYLEKIEALRDEAAEAEIAASEDAAVEATRNIEGLKIVMESYILDVEDKLTALAASASGIPLTLDVSQALSSIAEVMEAMEKLLQGAGGGVAPAAAAGAGAGEINVTVVGGAGQPPGELGREIADAIERGDTGGFQ